MQNETGEKEEMPKKPSEYSIKINLENIDKVTKKKTNKFPVVE